MESPSPSPSPSPLSQALLLRVVEEELLRLFSEGRVSGTTHTCIGQEMAAIALAGALDRERDVIYSNHRCHGHYLAWSDDVEGLVAEMMGRGTGVCGGLGGSQHLCAQGFFSNGIQGGIVPVAAGLALAAKRAGRGGIVAVCIGDGTLGEGVVYETFNLASLWQLPLLIVLENNAYSQSTAQFETLAGDIDARPAAFGITTFSGDTWNHERLAAEMREAVTFVRCRSRPAFMRVDTYRLAAHSKSDDDRDPAEIADYARRDPVNAFLADAVNGDGHSRVRARVRAAIESAGAAAYREVPASHALDGDDNDDGLIPVSAADIDDRSQLEAINRALAEWMAEDPSVVLLGEDVRSPYGGAFKVTRGLSDRFPARVLNAPISEAAIVGLGNGLALGGQRPIVEIMFGDFVTLCFDQLVNHASKFHRMYDGKVEVPLIVRTPMGGGRGYGPTHSQNLEKHLAGIPDLSLLVLHARTRVQGLYQALREHRQPTVIIENKLLYRERAGAELPPGFTRHEGSGAFPATVLRPPGLPDLTIVAFGRMSRLAEQVAARLCSDEEILAELVFPLRVSPLDVAPVRTSVARTGKLLVVEEGAEGFDLAAEVIAAICVDGESSQRRVCRRIAARAVPLPSAIELERAVLPDVDRIYAACLELFDA